MQKELKTFTDAELNAMVDDIVEKEKKKIGTQVTKRKLTPEEIKDAVGVKQAVRINFIPMMMASLAVKEANKMLDYAAANKVSEIKKHSRVMRDTIAKYEQTLTYAYGPAYKAYHLYVDRFLDETALNAWKMELQADTLAKNQQPGNPHPTVPAFALIVAMIIECCEEYDSKADKMISEKLNIESNRRKDVFMVSLLSLCRDILDKPEFRIEPDAAMKMWPGVISNQAWHLVERIIDEEDAEDTDR